MHIMTVRIIVMMAMVMLIMNSIALNIMGLLARFSVCHRNVNMIIMVLLHIRASRIVH